MGRQIGQEWKNLCGTPCAAATEIVHEMEVRVSRVLLALGFVFLLSACGTTGSGIDAGNEPVGGGGGAGSTGGGTGTDGGRDGGSQSTLAITTETIASAQVGLAYAQPFAASGGSAPYGWSIATRDAPLSWLTINSSSGVLSGVPNTSAQDAKVTVAVTDQAAVTVTRQFSLRVDACRDGASVVCTTTSGTSCVVGSQACTNGTLSGTCTGAPSTDASRCGATCGACGETADRCTTGECACGSGAACTAGQTCCAGSCKSLDDIRSCGSCTNDCAASAGAHVAALCANRQCAYQCAPTDFQHCVGATSVPPTANVSCETDTSSSVDSCGSCGHSCGPTTNTQTVTGSACVSSACRQTCAGQRLDCNSAPEDGCEIAFGLNNCGSCARVCMPGQNVTPSCSAGGQCGFACNANFAHCVGSTAVPPAELGACETNLLTDKNNCGSCGRQCAADQLCTGGNCLCDNSLCGTGQQCLASNRCGCDPSFCTGCCSSQGTGGACRGGTTASQCGLGGATCAACAATGCRLPSSCRIIAATGVCSCTLSTAAQICSANACSCPATICGN